MTQEQLNGPQSGKRTIVVIAVVVALFALLIAAKAMPSRTGGASPDGVKGQPVAPSITSVRNDALADYEAALQTGKPVYVLFHSLSCEPCVDISLVADEVIPQYEGELVFVNAITDDPSAQQLASRFTFQYIPTSFFIRPDGQVADSFTGAMDAQQMRGHLDSLVVK